MACGPPSIRNFSRKWTGRGTPAIGRQRTWLGKLFPQRQAQRRFQLCAGAGTGGMRLALVIAEAQSHSSLRQGNCPGRQRKRARAFVEAMADGPRPGLMVIDDFSFWPEVMSGRTRFAPQRQRRSQQRDRDQPVGCFGPWPCGPISGDWARPDSLKRQKPRALTGRTRPCRQIRTGTRLLEHLRNCRLRYANTFSGSTGAGFAWPPR